MYKRGAMYTGGCPTGWLGIERIWARVLHGKRGAARIACVPKKKMSNPTQQDFRCWVDHCIIEDQYMISSSQVSHDIEAITEQVLACGAQEGRDEHNIAKKKFNKLANQCFFHSMQIAEDQFSWLKRQFDEMKKI
jgi:hypothetical protein